MTKRVEPRLAIAASWASITGSFILSADTWVKLAELAGYSHRVSWAMVLVVDACVIGALVLWMMTTNRELGRFARKVTYWAAGIGVVAQSVYHGVLIEEATGDPWRVGLALSMGALPPLFAAVGIHMRSLGVIAKLTGVDSDKMTAGLLSLSLIHAAADTALTVTARVRELESELSLRTAELSATEDVLRAVTADTRPVSAPPADTDAPAVTVKRSSAKRQGEALAWLADNAGDSADAVLAKKLAEVFGVSVRTGFRYVEAYRNEARGGE